MYFQSEAKIQAKKFFLQQNPMTFWLIMVYGVTRLIELATGTSEFWSKSWNYLIDYLGDDDPLKLTVIYTTIYLNLIYFGFGALYLLIDVTNPIFFEKYRTQPATHVPLDLKKFAKAIMQVLFNQFILGTISSYIIYQFVYYGEPEHIRMTPNFSKVFFDFISFGIAYEIGFYFSHRFLHQKAIYKYVHKKHHEYTAPVALVAIYSHPIEHLLSTIIPFALGNIIFKYSLATTLINYTIGYITTLGDHSGYHLPFLHSPQFHDYHHLKFSENFGASGFIDEIFGTSKKFESTVQGKRHRTMFTFRPVNELYPEENERNKTE